MARTARWIGTGALALGAVGVGVLLRREPKGPQFDTLEADGAVSVRDYPELCVAETVTHGPREAALGFGLVGLEPFAAAPGLLLADGDDTDGRGWRTRVLIDGDTNTADNDDIRIRRLPARRVAAIRFSGYANDTTLDAYEAELRQWMEAHAYRPAGPVEHAYYGTPFTPAPLRRTEVLIPLAA